MQRLITIVYWLYLDPETQRNLRECAENCGEEEAVAQLRHELPDRDIGETLAKVAGVE